MISIRLRDSCQFLFKILWTTTLSNFVVFIFDSCIPGPIEVKLLCLMKVRLLVLELDDGNRLLIVVVLASVVMPIINDIYYISAIHVCLYQHNSLT